MWIGQDTDEYDSIYWGQEASWCLAPFNPNSPASGTVIPPVTQENTQCNPYKLSALCSGVTLAIEDCTLQASMHQGSVSVDTGGTGCQSDVVNTDCGYWTISLHDPKQSGTVKVKAILDGDFWDCTISDPMDPDDPCDSSPIQTQHWVVVAEIPVQVPSTSPPPPPPAPGGGSGGSGGCGCTAGNGGQGSQSGSAGNATADNDSVNFQLNLGAANARQYAGSLWLYAQTPSAALAQPVSLVGPVSQPGVEVLTDINGVIQQVLSPEMLVNVAIVDDYQYLLQCFYAKDVGTLNDDGLYTTNAPAFTTWTVENPDGASATNRLWIIEERNETNRNFEYTYTAQSNRWDLLEPDGQTTISTWNIPNPTDSTITNQFRQVSYAGTVVQQSQKTIQYIGNLTDTILLQEVDGNGTTSSTTTYTYYPGSNTDGSANRLQRIDYPDGRWIYDQYDSWGRKVTEFSAYGNNPPPAAGTVPNPYYCKETTYAYMLDFIDDGTDYPGDPNNPWAVCKTIVSIPVQTSGGWALQEVSRTYSEGSVASGWVETQQCANPGAPWDDPANLKTITYSNVGYDWSDGLNGLPSEVTHPDGSVTYYSYDDVTTAEWDPDGSETITLTDDLGNPLSRTKSVGNVTLSEDTYNYTDAGGDDYDPLLRGHDVTDLAGRTTQYRYDDCCGYSTVTDPDGATTQYDYDLLKRRVASTVYYGNYGSGPGIKTTNVLNAINQVVETQRIGTDNSVITLSQSQYDLLGRIIAQTNALGGVTSTAYAVVNNQLYITKTYPDGGVRVETYYGDGRLQSVTGTAVHPVEYLYGAEQDTDGTWREYTQEIKLTASNGTNEWTKTYVDGCGRTYKTIYSSASGSNPSSQSFYNEYGQLWKTVDPDGVTTLYVYDNSGDFNQGQVQYTITALSTTALGLTTYDSLVTSLTTLQRGIDRIQMFSKSVVAADGSGQPDLVQVNKYAWIDGENDGTGKLLSSVQNSTDGLQTWNMATGDVNTTVTTHSIIVPGTSRTNTIFAQDNSYSVNAYSYGQLVSSTRYDSTGAQIGGTTYAYDAHGRQQSVTDACNGTTTYGYNRRGRGEFRDHASAWDRAVR